MSDINIEKMTTDAILRMATDIAVKEVPVTTGDIKDQEYRKQTPQFIFVRMIRRLNIIINDLQNTIKKQRNELIEVKKELSKLKRNK